MAALIWDDQKQAFVEPEPPLAYNPAIDAWQETMGCTYDHGKEAWEEVWPQKLMIYDAGTECDGGLTTFYSSYWSVSAEARKDVNYIILTGSINTMSGVCTNTMVNLESFKKICANVEIHSAADDKYDSIDVCALDKRVSGNTTDIEKPFGNMLAVGTTTEKQKIVTIEADISQLKESAYISVRQYYIAFGCVYQIWLE